MPSSLNLRRVLAWTLFDFANSAYAAVIIVAVFAVYYAQAIVGNDAGLGDLWWGRVVSVSMLAVALTAPGFGALADRRGLRKRFFVAFTVLCIACLALFPTIRPGMILWGFALAALANFGFESSQVYYNAYLIDVAPPEQRGFVSGLGFAIGYLGSILGLVAALPLVNAGRFDLVWLMVAAFFAVFALPAFFGLPGDRPRPSVAPAPSIRRLLRDAWGRPPLRRFLLAYFVYFDGVQTTIYFSGIFAAQSLGFTTAENIKLFLAVQVAALIGALLLARPTDRWGAKRVVTLSLVVWVGVALAAFVVTTKSAFLVVAVVAGTQLGAIQAASRALMASLIPTGTEAEMFGFYAFCGRSSSVLGPLVFGAVSFALGGNQRAAVLSVAAFFVVGMALLQRVQAGAPATARGSAGPDPTERRP